MKTSTLLFDLWVVANSTRALLDHALRSTGLTAQEFAVYSAIRRCVGGVTPSRLRRSWDSPQRRSLLLSPGLNPTITSAGSEIPTTPGRTGSN